MIKAVIDIGTNSCRLLVADQQGEKIKTIHRQLITTRIGQGLGKGAGQLSQAAMERTLTALQQFHDAIQGYSPVSVHLLGTQALRQATNSDYIQEQVQRRLGWQLKIISGDREAYLSCRGALSAMPDLKQAAVLDIGGGSTEIMLASGGEVAGASTPIGCLRLLEAPMCDAEIKKALLKGWSDIRIPANSTLVGVGGTATTLGAIFLEMAVYDGDALAKCRLSRAEVQAVLERLEGLSLSERLKLPGMLAGREDVMPYGLRILLAVMDIYQLQDLRICDRDLMYGILLEEANY